MKKLIPALLFLLPLIAHAETLPTTVCGAGEGSFCQNLTPDIPVLTYNPVYGSVYVIVDNVQYIGYAPRNVLSFQTTVKDPVSGMTKVVTLSFSVIRHKAPGRNSIVNIWALDSGDVS